MKRVRWLAAAMLLCAARPNRLTGQSTIIVDSVLSPGLRANLVGDNPVRKVLVYLPPSYRHQTTRRYPVIYLLHGTTSKPEEWLNGVYQGMNLQVTLDSLIAGAAIPEFIVVMPDANNALGADWYTNSPVTGMWQDFVVKDLVGYVDGHYRTEANRSRRALVGHSMGGFGALGIGFEHPMVFGLIYAISPCCIGFVGRLAPSAPTWAALSAAADWRSAGDQFEPAVGMAAAFDGDKSNPRLFSELPFELRNGAIVPNRAAQTRWLSKMPPDLASAMVRRGERAPEIRIETGSEEPPMLEGVALLRARLDSLRIPYKDTVFVGGHVDRVRERFTKGVLPVVGRWFTAAGRGSP